MCGEGYTTRNTFVEAIQTVTTKSGVSGSHNQTVKINKIKSNKKNYRKVNKNDNNKYFDILHRQLMKNTDWIS